MPVFYFPRLFFVQLQGGPHYFLYCPKIDDIWNNKFSWENPNLDQYDYDIQTYFNHNETQMMWAIEL